MGLKAMGVSDGPQIYISTDDREMVGWNVVFRWLWGDGAITNITLFKDTVIESWLITNCKGDHMLTRSGVVFTDLDDAVLCLMTFA